MTFTGFDAVFFTVGFLVPGFVWSAVLSMLIPRREVEPQVRVLEFLTFSCVNHGIWSWLLFIILRTGFVDYQPILSGLLLFGIIFLSPVGLALLTGKVHQNEWMARFLNRLGFRTIHPTPTAWDYFFSQEKPCWALVTLNDGSEVYGLFGNQSFASSDPRNRDIYFEASYRLLDTGDWAPVEDTAGILIAADQIVAIEFRNLQNEESEKNNG